MFVLVCEVKENFHFLFIKLEKVFIFLACLSEVDFREQKEENAIFNISLKAT